MQEEQQGQSQEQNQPSAPPAPTEAPASPEPPPELKAPEGEHDVVTPGATCSKCGWKWGADTPHVVTFAVGNEPPKAGAKPVDPNTCLPVAMGSKCPKCGWDSNDPKTSMNPHPVLGV